jgi:hypothetical protein
MEFILTFFGPNSKDRHFVNISTALLAIQLGSSEGFYYSRQSKLYLISNLKLLKTKIFSNCSYLSIIKI